MKDKANKKKNRIKKLVTRRGVLIVALIVALVLIINLITVSYSWFTPQEDTKQGMRYGFSGKVRSENCTMTTFVGTKVTSSNRQSGEYIDQIRYSNSGSANSVTLLPNTTNYFKTEILNADTKNASDISLFCTGLPACTLAVTYPGNTVRKYTSAPTGEIYIVRDAFVKRKDTADVNGPGKLEIEWFVITGSTGGTLNLTLLYN